MCRAYQSFILILIFYSSHFNSILPYFKIQFYIKFQSFKLLPLHLSPLPAHLLHPHLSPSLLPSQQYRLSIHLSSLLLLIHLSLSLLLLPLHLLPHLFRIQSPPSLLITPHHSPLQPPHHSPLQPPHLSPIHLSLHCIQSKQKNFLKLQMIRVFH